MNFYVRQFKNDFIQSTISIKVLDGALDLSWFKGQQVNNLETQAIEIAYPDKPTVSKVVSVSEILTERKTGIPLNNPHQILACSVNEESSTFAFVDVLKYTFTTKGSTGFFKTQSGMSPIMYILVPFADSPISEWTFIVIANKVTVDGNTVKDEFDIDINKTLADICNENLPSISISKSGTSVSAQLIDTKGKAIKKSGVDIYFETTAGYLTKSRGRTDTKGLASTEVIGAEEGKIKAGFKYFTGKVDLII